MRTWKSFKKELLKKPGVRKEYEKMKRPKRGSLLVSPITGKRLYVRKPLKNVCDEHQINPFSCWIIDPAKCEACRYKYVVKNEKV